MRQSAIASTVCRFIELSKRLRYQEYYLFLFAAFCFAHRAFCAREIAARAFADIFRPLGRPRFPVPGGRPGPRFAARRPRWAPRATLAA